MTRNYRTFVGLIARPTNLPDVVDVYLPPVDSLEKAHYVTLPHEHYAPCYFLHKGPFVDA